MNFDSHKLGNSFILARTHIMNNYESPEKLQSFRFPDIKNFNWATDWFDFHSEGNNNICLSGPNIFGSWQEISYSEVSYQSTQLAIYLQSQGVKQGDGILLDAPSSIEVYLYLLAILKLGSIAIPVHNNLHPEALRNRMSVAKPQWIIAEHGQNYPGMEFLQLRHTFKASIDYISADVAPSEYFPTVSADIPAFGCFTSGTTGSPKLVLHSHRTHSIAHLSSLIWNHLRPGERHLNISSPGWAKFFWSSFLVPLTSGATVVIKPDDLTPDKLQEFLCKHNIQSMCAPVPFLNAAFSSKTIVASSLKDITSVGEPIPESLKIRIRDACGLTVRSGFGQSEATAILGELPGDKGTLQKLPGYEVRLRTVPGDPAARLEFRTFPSGSFLGYIQHGLLVAPEITSDGWQWTGDFAEGQIGKKNFRLLGRGDDVFRINGHLIAPAEIEEILCNHPAVSMAAVTYEYDQDSTLTAIGLVVLDPTEDALLEKELNHWVNERLPDDVAISKISFVTSLPMSINGKLQRKLLRSNHHM